MPIDKEVREFLVQEVNSQLAEHLGSFRAECNTKCTTLFERMNRSEADRIALHTRMESDRELLSLNLKQLNDKMDWMMRQFEGDGNGGVMTRLAIVEQKLAMVNQDENQRKSGRGDMWRQILSQGIVPIFLSWVGLGTFYLIYLAVTHASKGTP